MRCLKKDYLRRSQLDRLDALIAVAEARRLPAHLKPRTLILISGDLPNQQRIGIDVGTKFRIRGGLPPLPYDSSEAQLLHDARQRLTDVLVSFINMLATAGSPDVTGCAGMRSSGFSNIYLTIAISSIRLTFTLPLGRVASWMTSFRSSWPSNVMAVL
jgi:hypothetical protein